MERRTPEIRFKGFTEKWEKKKYQEIAEVKRGLIFKPEDICNDGVRVLRSSNILDDNFIEKEDDVFVNDVAININFAENMDILITSANGSSRLVGKHAIIHNLSKRAVHGGFMLLVKAESPYFLNASMNSPWYYKFIAFYTAGGNGAIGNLSKASLDNQQIDVPTLSEQTKIGEFFKNIDNLIAVNQRKYEKLLSIKKALLEKMFPKSGADTPEIRFKGFTEKWEKKQLNEIAEIIGGGTPNTTISEYWNGNIDWYSPIEIGDKIYSEGSIKKITELGLQKSSAKILPAGITILFTSRAGIGNMSILKQNGSTNQGFQSIVLKTGYHTYFVYSMGHLIKRYAEQYSYGSTFLEISGKILGMFTTSTPNFPEQTKIGEFFKNIDNLIAVNQRKYEKLLSIKKALLEKMFI